MRPLQTGFVAFVLTSVALHFVLGPPPCADGWVSPSIGRQGACSWHGGVSHRATFLALCVGLAVALLDARLLAGPGPSPEERAERERTLAERDRIARERSQRIEEAVRRSTSALGANQSANSRQPWNCEDCRHGYASGTVYWYRTSGYGRATARVKYCPSCRANALAQDK